ncbi:MAG: inositol monophosphatase [Candidatus Marinimicrobia bacterium CG08_land_8_20_14_0_20_45_22]|nr:MAG: inositol monophosphatase [Candidatus Marinimicrobia bacterium CG08_land_8_20_14_0_20_45_22]
MQFIDEKLERKLLNTALVAAQAVGKLLIKKLNTTLSIDFKGRANMVTEADHASENLIIEMIQHEFPDHQILTEERPQIESNSGFKWIIDPLDGTTNFVHGFPMFAVSIGLEIAGEMFLGVVLHPTTGEIFSAIRGRGAFLNKKPIFVSSTEKLSHSLLATGFPYELDASFYRNMELFKRFYVKCQGVRRPGAAALDLCYLACGRYDGFWEFSLHPWDVAAASVIISEAGGFLSDFQGEAFSVYKCETLATNGKITHEMLDILKIS